ncbi:MAG: hypothetical protein ABSD59_09485 [Terracidiphilus sp.]
MYVSLSDLYFGIFNEVLQFFLIWLGALIIPILGMMGVGGWSGLKQRIFEQVDTNNYVHLWSTAGTFSGNPMGVHWTGIVFGLGGAIARGYWTTDFLVVKRAMAAKDLRSAQLAPIIASYFKMVVPLIVILPGLLGLAVLPYHLVPESAMQPGLHSYNEVLPLMLARYCTPGLLGLGITALIAYARRSLTMLTRRHMLPVWFFIGLLLTLYRVIILIASIVDWTQPSQAVLAQYHPGLWGGGVLLLVGGLYLLRFRPRRPRGK